MILPYSIWKSYDNFNTIQVTTTTSFINENDVVANSSSTSEADLEIAQARVRSAIFRMSRGKTDGDAGALRFVSALMVSCRIIWDVPEVKTMATDGHNLYISSKFVDALTDKQIVGIFAHEMFHIALVHMRRQIPIIGAHPSKGVFNVWNQAADYEINLILANEGLMNPSDFNMTIDGKKFEGCYDAKYADLSAEEIYPLLTAENEKHENEREYLPPVVGALIKIKEDGSIAKITKINPDGSIECDILSDAQVEEARAIFKQFNN